MMNTLTVNCEWEDEMVRERTGHLLSYAKAKNEVANTSYPLPMAALGPAYGTALLLLLLHVYVLCILQHQ